MIADAITTIRTLSVMKSNAIYLINLNDKRCVIAELLCLSALQDKAEEFVLQDQGYQKVESTFFHVTDGEGHVVVEVSEIEWMEDVSFTGAIVSKRHQ